MQEVPIKLNVVALVIILGIFLGIINSYFLIVKSWHKKSPNLVMGFFLLVLSLIMLEGWLNYTGFIFKVLWLTNFAEPLNFAVAPFIYFFMTSLLGEKRKKQDFLHLIPFVFWLCYCFFYFTLPDIYKYNDSISIMQLNMPYVNTNLPYTGDPLKIRYYVNIATIIHIVIYNVILTIKFVRKARQLGESIFRAKNKMIISVRNSFYHFIIITVILIFVKSIFESDVGDYLIFLYISFMIFMTSYQIMDSSSYYLEASSFLEGPVLKYKKSSLVKENKAIILDAIIKQMQNEKYFLSSTASLAGLAKSINVSPHHVSQVINEKLNRSFFEMLALYRIEEAKIILKTDLGKLLTIEEVAERVGYNSKSAFNTAFKKFTSQTPSSFRDT